MAQPYLVYIFYGGRWLKFVNIVVYYFTVVRLYRFSAMRRAAEEARKAETPKHFELTPSIIYLLFYNGAQALGLVRLV